MVRMDSSASPPAAAGVAGARATREVPDPRLGAPRGGVATSCAVPSLPFARVLLGKKAEPPRPSSLAGRPANGKSGDDSAPLARGKGEPRDARPDEDRPRRDDDALDPMARHAAQLGAPPLLSVAPPVAASAPIEPPAVAAARASLEELLPAMVKRVAWSGDARRGAVRLEIGSGALAGGTLLVSADEGRVRVHLDAPAGVDRAEWKDRIESRLAAKGVALDGVDVE